MKLLQIAYTNEKGQLVIPKKLRDKFSIDENVPLQIEPQEEGIYITPLRNLRTNNRDEKQKFLDLLQKTQGAWSELPQAELDKLDRLEKKLSKERRKVW